MASLNWKGYLNWIYTYFIYNQSGKQSWNNNYWRQKSHHRLLMTDTHPSYRYLANSDLSNRKSISEGKSWCKPRDTTGRSHKERQIEIIAVAKKACEPRHAKRCCARYYQNSAQTATFFPKTPITPPERGRGAGGPGSEVQFPLTGWELRIQPHQHRAHGTPRSRNSGSQM